MTKVHYLRNMLGVDADTRMEANLPFFWVGGLVMGLFTVLSAGGTLVCSDRTRYGNGQVIGATTGQDNPYPDLRMTPALGMTETFGMYSWGSHWRSPGYELAAPLEQFQPGFEVKIVGEEGTPVADGGRGEILVRGPSLACRLHKVKRTDCFDADGYYRTGDEGQLDGDTIHFTGRLGDMIKTSGANVSPAEVEQELGRIEGVYSAHVVGLPDPSRGESVAAAVVAEPGTTLVASELRAQLTDRLSSYKLPTRIVVYASQDDIPMTPSMKVHKVALAAQLALVDAECG
jgi:acyl-CoA synthetase (AMP-forming)/AMP-acid ligase II